MDHINVPLMPLVPTQLVLIPVPVILVIQEMEELVVTSMNVLVGHIHVQLMLHVQTQMDLTPVPVKMASLEMDTLVTT